MAILKGFPPSYSIGGTYVGFTKTQIKIEDMPPDELNFNTVNEKKDHYLKLCEIEQTINKLNAEKNTLVKKVFHNNKINEKFTKSLVWTKECDAEIRFVYNGFNLIISPYEPVVVNSVTIVGETITDPDRVVFHPALNNAGANYFFVSSEKALYDFLNTTQFKKITYDEKHLRILEFVKNKSEKLK